MRRSVRLVCSKAFRSIHFDGPLEAEYLAYFDRIGRRSRSELWLILAAIVVTVTIFNRVILDVPAQVMPLGRLLIIGVLVPMVLRWLSSDQSPVGRWSSELYIASVYIDIAALMTLRAACLNAGIDVVPLILPVAFLVTMIVVQIRFVLLVPAILVGLLGMIAFELSAFEVNSNRLFDIAAASALVTVALTAAYSLEFWTRRGWLRQRELDAMAMTDPLTGLANRRHLEETLREAVESGDDVTLMILDLDHFKAYNDCYGHLAGDRCLTAIGKYLMAATSHSGVAARLGGEEFAVMWRGGDAAMAERVRRGLSSVELEPRSGTKVAITASAGFAAMTPGHDEAALFARADAALYAAKRAGRDRLVVESLECSWGSGFRTETNDPRSRGDDEPDLELVHPLRFSDPSAEAEFRAAFDAEGRTARRLIMVGLLLVIVWLLTFATPVLQIPPAADRLGRMTLIFGLAPGALLALVGNTWSRLRRWAPQLYILGVAIILTAQLYEREIQLPLGYDVVPFIMPFSVLISLTVVQIRFTMLVPAAVAATAGVVMVELVAFPWTGNRLLSVIACVVMMSAALRFAYRFECMRRLAWRAEQRLDALARMDPLTGLPNRRQFDNSLTDMLALARSSAGRMVFMLIDIDHFKAYNDRLGHLAGDDCLRDVGRHLAQQMSGCDGMAARIGGEEFAVVWIDVDGDGTRRAEELRRGVAALGVTASAGILITTAVDAPSTLAETIRRVDAPLYSAKRAGRDRSTIAMTSERP